MEYQSDTFPLPNAEAGLPPPKRIRKRPAPAATGNGPQLSNESHSQADSTTPDPDGQPRSALDLNLTVTTFRDVKARESRETRTTLRAFAETIESRRATRKADLPLLKLATFGDARSDRGAIRHDGNLVAVHGVEVEHDAGTMTVEDAEAALQEWGVAGLIHTTPSHTAAAPRWRLLCPLAEPVAAGERRALVDRLDAVLGYALAPESGTASQAFYYGRVEGVPFDLRLVDGGPLDCGHVGDMLDLFGPSRPAEAASVESAPDPNDDDDLEALLERHRVPEWPRIESALAVTPSDDRETWLTVGMALHEESGASGQGFATWSSWSATSPKFNAKDQARTWESFGRSARAAVGIGTVFKLAKDHGWSAKAPDAPAEPDAPEPSKPSGLTFLTPGECEGAPSRGYVVKGMIAPRDVGCVFGPPGAGKSLIAPSIGYAVAQGESSFGMRSKEGGVLYVAAEDPHGMRSRVAALKRKQGAADRFVLVDGVANLLADKSADLKALTAAVRERRPALVILDTLAMAFPGLEENDAASMGKVVAVARSLTRWGAAVVLVHHDTKADGATPRGHSVLNGALDFALHVKRGDDGIVRGRLTKNRNGSCDRDIAFTIGVEVMGEDEDGDDVTAAVAVELDPDFAPQPERKLTAAQRAVLAVLRDLESGGGTSGTDGLCPGPVPVSREALRDACMASSAVCASESRDSRKKAFNRAFGTLVGQGVVHECPGDMPTVSTRKPFDPNEFDEVDL